MRKFTDLIKEIHQWFDSLDAPIKFYSKDLDSDSIYYNSVYKEIREIFNHNQMIVNVVLSKLSLDSNECINCHTYNGIDPSGGMIIYSIDKKTIPMWFTINKNYEIFFHDNFYLSLVDINGIESVLNEHDQNIKEYWKMSFMERDSVNSEISKTRKYKLTLLLSE